MCVFIDIIRLKKKEKVGTWWGTRRRDPPALVSWQPRRRGRRLVIGLGVAVAFGMDVSCQPHAISSRQKSRFDLWP